ncbi:MAG: hypothetical protein J6W62_07395 [Spirochaetia bacterium]|nr:hypothetical protein [Spirochaetia bacterium]
MESQIKFFQCDMISLNDYHHGYRVSFDDVKRRLLLKQRELNVGISDNCYKLNQKKSFYGIDSFISFFTKAIPDYIKKYLYINQTKIYVKEDYFIEWQDLITNCSPLFLMAEFLHSLHILSNFDWQEVQHIFSLYILENSRYTALVSPNIKPLDDFFEQNKGFYDLHIHLNGITESDAVWQSFLSDKYHNLYNISKKINTDSFKQQLEQMGLDYSLNDFLSLINRAKAIREYFFRKIFCDSKHYMQERISSDSFYNPFLMLVGKPEIPMHPNRQLRYELLMYIIVLKYLEKEQDEHMAMCLHEYLLIAGFFHQLLVQNSMQFGFTQFQNITLNDIRAETDRNQLNKFLQICGNNLKNINTIELRFSPKDSIDKQMPILRQIKRDWEKLQEIVTHKDPSYDFKPNYVLIAHFIKQKDKDSINIPFEKLRTNLEKKKLMLQSLKNMGSALSKKIVAIDAASSEFDTPPEVFAPFFNELREKQCFNHMTYHAGEDFYHILSGLRAIYEVIMFMQMKNGDRIGHATATGIDIETWLSIVGKQILLPKGEYLDDLVFAYNLINEEHIEELFHILQFLNMNIEKLSYEVYDEAYNVSLLIDCWKMRNQEPRNIKFDGDKKKKDYFEKYNNKIIRKKYNEPVEINVTDVFNVDQLVKLQQAILCLMQRKEIIIETLPTSNLRIGYHKTLESYQLFNWFKWRKKGIPIPPIILGTDDPGIFSTNIYNEFALIYCYMVYKENLSRSETMTFLQEINANSRIYSFSGEKL